VMETKLINTKG